MHDYCPIFKIDSFVTTAPAQDVLTMLMHDLITLFKITICVKIARYKIPQ